MAEIKKIGMYMRSSTDHQEVLIQKEQLHNYIEYLRKQNPSVEFIVYEYIDEGLSGSKAERPSFQRLINDVQNSKLSSVIVLKLDRLSRTLRHLLETVDTFKKHSCDFIVVKDNIDTSTSNGRLLFYIIGAFAEFERETIRERMQLGREKAERQGTKSGKPCHRPKIDIDVDGVVKKFEDGMSMNQISKHYGVSITVVRNRLKERGIYGKIRY